MTKPVTTVSPVRGRRNFWPMLISLGLAGFLYGCSAPAQELPPGQVPADSPAASAADTAAPAPVATGRMQKGMYFPPGLPDYQLHNEYDDDGNGDGIKETHVRRYINSKGDSAFSMTTNGTVWAWSLDIKGDDDSDIHKNYVIRDSNCDKVFDERYSLDAQFRVPACLKQNGQTQPPGGT